MSESGEGFKLDETKFKDACKYVADKFNAVHLHDILHQDYPGKKREDMSYTEKLETKLERKYCMTQKEAGLVEALTNGTAVFYALQEDLTAHLMGQQGRNLTEDEERFVTMYSLYAGCVETLTELEDIVDFEDVEEFQKIKDLYKAKVWGKPQQKFKLTDDRETILDEYTKLYAHGLVVNLGIKNGEGFIYKKNSTRGGTPRELTKDGNLTGMTFNFVNSLLEHLIDEAEKKEYAPLRDIFDFPLGLHEATISGFDYRVSSHALDETEFQLNVDFKDIIGNDEPKELLQYSLEKLFLYDPHEQHNPFMDIGEIPRTVLLYAGPGTGKTMTLKAAIKYAYELGELTDKKVKVVEVSQVFKDKYVGESAKKLKGILAEGMSPDGIGIITVEDIDALFSNRSQVESGTSQAEQNALQELLNLLEGLKTKYYGNWIVLATSNRAHGIDKALKDRIAQFQVYCPGATTLDELMKLSQDLSSKGVENKYLDVSDAEWKQIAEVAKKNQYNGRQIRNAAMQLLTDVGLFEIDKSLYKESPEKQQAWYLKNMRKRKVSGQDLLSAVKEAAEHDQQQLKYDMEEKVKSWEERHYTSGLGQSRAMKKMQEAEAKDINDEFETLGPEGEKLLRRMQTDEMQRMEGEMVELTRQKKELEQQLAEVLALDTEEPKKKKKK